MYFAIFSDSNLSLFLVKPFLKEEVMSGLRRYYMFCLESKVVSSNPDSPEKNWIKKDFWYIKRFQMSPRSKKRRVYES